MSSKTAELEEELQRLKNESNDRDSSLNEMESKVTEFELRHNEARIKNKKLNEENKRLRALYEKLKMESTRLNKLKDAISTTQLSIEPNFSPNMKEEAERSPSQTSIPKVEQNFPTLKTTERLFTEAMDGKAFFAVVKKELTT